MNSRITYNIEESCVYYILDKIKLIRVRRLYTRTLSLDAVNCKFHSCTVAAIMLTYSLVHVLCFHALVHQLNGHDGNTSLVETSNAVFRLPGTTVPDYYDLRFELQNFTGPDNLTFSGQVNIHITVVSTTEVVTLNVRDLNVTTVTVTDISNVSRPLDLKISKWLYLANDEQFEIHLIRSIPLGKYLRLSITYVGNVRTDMTGLYLDSYEERGTTK